MLTGLKAENDILLYIGLLVIFGNVLWKCQNYQQLYRNATPSEATLSVINKLITLSLEKSASFGEFEIQDGYGSDTSFNSPNGVLFIPTG